MLFNVFKRHAPMFLLLLFLGGILVLDVLSEPVCQVDEPHWITTSYVTWRLVSGDRKLQWKTAYKKHKLGDWGHKNPPLGKLLIGASVAASGLPAKAINYRWKWPHSYFYNLRTGRLPPRHLLKSVRLFMVGLSVFVLLFVYLIAFKLTLKPTLSLLAPLVLFALPVYRSHSVVVYTDIPQLLFLVMGIYAYLAFLEKERWGWLVLASSLWGLSCAVKFSSGVLVAGAVLFCFFLTMGWKKRVLSAFLIGALSLFSFFAVNPYLYSHPAQKLGRILKSWSKTKQSQQKSGHFKTVQTRGKAFSLMFRSAFFSPFQMKGRAPASFLWIVLLLFCFFAALDTARLWFEGARPDMRRLSEIRLFFGCLLLGLLLSLFFWNTFSGLFGGVLLSFSIRLLTSWREEDIQQRQRKFLFFAFWSSFVLTALWLPLDWSRYYLPVLLFFPLLFVAGLDRFVQSVATKNPVSSTEEVVSSKRRERLLRLLFPTGVVIFSLGFAIFWVTQSSAISRQQQSALTSRSMASLVELWDGTKNREKKVQLSSIIVDRLFMMRRLQDALLELKKVQPHAPKHPELMFRHAMVLLWSRKPLQARKILKEAVSLYPGNKQLKRAYQMTFRR